MPVRALVVLLATAPAGIFTCHAVAYRVLRNTGRRPTAHTSALIAIVVWFVVTLGAAAGLMVHAAVPLSSLVCGGAYTLAVFAALAVLYIDVVNIAETSLHMHVLLEVTWTEQPSLSWLVDRYGAERLINERIDRLMALGQIRESRGRYLIANRSTLRVNAAIDRWRRVLALPTSPESAENP